ncbi:MAG: hypothetical protein OXD31_17250 [Chloroflexi bacterium]|nr:hypothetical protein [Chloroflexota bacterium]
MPDIDMWAIDMREQGEVCGTELPASAERIWQGKNCETVLVELMCICDSDGLYSGSPESENMVLRPADVARVEAAVLGQGEDSESGAAEAREFIELARTYHRERPDKALVVGAWI